MTLVQFYVQTNDSDDTTNDTFYELLQAVLEALPRHDSLVVPQWNMTEQQGKKAAEI